MVGDVRQPPGRSGAGPTNQLEIVRCTPGDLTPPTLHEAAVLLQDLVRDDAALGWVDPPAFPEVAELLRAIAADGTTSRCARRAPTRSSCPSTCSPERAGWPVRPRDQEHART
ncbi:MAG: hypothetical protein ACRYG2_21765 [Janthinobacterium lividum]